MPRVVVPLVVAAAFVAFASCGGETKTSGGGAAPPPGAGYGSSAPPPEDMRVLSRDDCLALRDHQIDIAVAEAMTGQNDPGKRLEIEARVRAENKDKTEAWVKSCSGRSVPAKLLRCWKDAGSPRAYVACDLPPSDAAVDG